MARHFSPEETRGLAGEGLVSSESLRYQRMADDLCARGRPNQAFPFMIKAMEDKNNVDIFVSYAFVQQNYREALAVLEDGRKRGEKSLKSKFGPEAFVDGGPLVGKFYEEYDTRPYMRVLQAIVRVAVECKRYQKAADTIIEMFRLNPQDPMQQHKWLPTLLCRLKRYADTLYFCQLFLDIFVGRVPRSDLPPEGGTRFLAPRRGESALYTSDEQESFTLYGSTILYSAALASFHLEGDCEEGRMYLRAATRANPTVMIRILKRSQQPESLDENPRTWNSPADAHDYLWLAQDLWMGREVWDWVNITSKNDPDVTKTVQKGCARPGCDNLEKKAGEFQLCSGCQTISYCSAACQKGDWLRHKSDCKVTQQMTEIGRAISKGKPISTSNDIPVFATDISSDGIRGYNPAPNKMTPEQEADEAERQRKKKEKKKEMNKKKEERRKAKKREEREREILENGGKMKAIENSHVQMELGNIQKGMASASLE
ncbi:hypothetical protein GYMLUDRAFT_35209 [Collybiopsis luxurians FD-317 M1]|nr:hypothetical protein GYMLUDRAFT_35209 [Collybiopsis luxurians FD-317 M1]